MLLSRKGCLIFWIKNSVPVQIFFWKSVKITDTFKYLNKNKYEDPNPSPFLENITNIYTAISFSAYSKVNPSWATPRFATRNCSSRGGVAYKGLLITGIYWVNEVKCTYMTCHHSSKCPSQYSWGSLSHEAVWSSNTLD